MRRCFFIWPRCLPLSWKWNFLWMD